ncbi:MAG: carbonic anhydrase family protein [Planctomycetota bacterium]
MKVLENLKTDLPASIVVFFVAVPLCLGIALASGAPLFSGLVAGIIGGIVVGAISGSPLGVSGPAAGLTIIVFQAIDDLDTFEAFLVAVVLAGVFQVALGVARAGVLGYFFPNSVIKGMLSAIGIIIILKQIPHAFGYDKDPEGELQFVQPDGESTTLSSLSEMWESVDPRATLVAFVCLGILILWETVLSKRGKVFKLIQGPLVVVAFGILYQLITRSAAPDWALAQSHLVSVPVAESLSGFFEQFRTPDWSALAKGGVWITGVTIAIVASLETLLCVEATDKLDPWKRVTPTNRELFAQGTGNMLSGLVGGLPVTQVIVRSSANIQSGAKTKLSAILHGMFLLLFVAALPAVLNLIPLAALAAILFVVGYKLAKPSIFKAMFSQGRSQFIPFLATILGIVFTDLLVGILIGLGVAVAFLLYRSYQNSHFLHIEETVEEDNRPHIELTMAEEVSFLNKGAILKELTAIPHGAHVTIDMRGSYSIDRDVREILDDFKQSAENRSIQIDWIGADLLSHNAKSRREVRHQRIPGKITNGDEPLATQNKHTQASLTPKLALQMLKVGNERFQKNLKADRNLLKQVNETRSGQWPFAVVLSCIDSRTSAELIFDQGLGDIFSVRIAGNFINEDILGSMEFACKVAGSKLVVVLGHSHCGAVKGAVDNVQMGNLTTMLSKVRQAVELVESPRSPSERTSANARFVQDVATQNVYLSIDAIRSKSDILREMHDAGEIDVVGAMYDVESGAVKFLEVEAPVR